jgi:hypothetical protein
MNIEPEHPHHHSQTGLRWLDILITVAVLLVSVTSLILTIVHSKTLERMADANERMAEASAWPFIDYSTGNFDSGKNVVSMSIDNDGIGPAKIETFELKWKGRSYRDAPAFLEACCGYDHRPGDGLQFSMVSGRVMRPGSRTQFLYLPRPPGFSRSWDSLNAARLSHNLEVNVCYCSVFDECWTGDTTLFTLEPRSVDKCRPPRVLYAVPE